MPIADEDNFRRVVETIPRLVERGIGVRIATTVEGERTPTALRAAVRGSTARSVCPTRTMSCAPSSIVGGPSSTPWASRPARPTSHPS